MFKITFRPTRAETPLWWLLLKIVLQTVVFWTLFLLVFPAGLIWLEGVLGWPAFRFDGQRVLGVILFVLGGSLGLTSGATMGIYGRGTPVPFDTARQLVVAGPYRFVRNPMAIAGLVQGAAVGLYFGSGLVLAYVVVGMVLWNICVRPVEEQDLETRFGEAFVAYRREVRCWVPRWKGYRAVRK